MGSRQFSQKQKMAILDSAAQIGVKTFMRRKFGALFKDEFIFTGLKLPERMQSRMGQLRLAEVSARNGWFAGGWSRAKDEPTAGTAE